MTKEKKRMISELVADLAENKVIEEVQRCLAMDVNPLEIIDRCQSGIIEVGRRYEKGEYYISGLIMAGEIMRQVSDLVQPALRDRFVGHVNGRVLVGTVQGDIHYIGKNIFKILLQCFGFTVSDVGEDVTPDEMLKQAIVFSPHIIGLSCLVTAAYNAMRDTVSRLRAGTDQLDPLPKIVVGGMVDETVCQYVGADRWCQDAMDGVRICQDFLQSISRISERPRSL